MADGLNLITDSQVCTNHLPSAYGLYHNYLAKTLHRAGYWLIADRGAGQTKSVPVLTRNAIPTRVSNDPLAGRTRVVNLLMMPAR